MGCNASKGTETSNQNKPEDKKEDDPQGKLYLNALKEKKLIKDIQKLIRK